MKIGFSMTSLENSLNRGIIDGIGHYSRQLFEGMKKRNADSLGFAFPPIIRHARILHSETFPRSYVSQILGSKFGFCNPLSPQVDIFHSTDFRVVPMNVPVVSTMWDAIPWVHPEWMRNGIAHKLAPRLFKESAKYADCVICTSEHAAKDVMSYYSVPENNINIIPWALPEYWKIPVNNIDITNLKKKLSIDSEYILTVGTLQPRKNIELLIDAFLRVVKHPKINDIKLVIVGKTGWKCGNILKKIYSNQHCIVYLNNIDNDKDLKTIYQGARAFAFPSLYEGFGMPVLEAFASNLPLLASDNTSIPEITGDAAILVNPYSIYDVSNGLKEILLNDDVAMDLIKRGNQRLKRYSEEQMLDKLKVLYNKLISG